MFHTPKKHFTSLTEPQVQRDGGVWDGRGAGVCCTGSGPGGVKNVMHLQTVTQNLILFDYEERVNLQNRQQKITKSPKAGHSLGIAWTTLLRLIY